MISKHAIDALTHLANAASPRESVRALSAAREALGPHADALEPLLASLAQRSEELGQLRHLVGSDWLTGVSNRRGFEQTLVREVARHQRTLEPFALILLDLDNLKECNDAFGHAAGDAALMATARACENVVRSTDLVARLGGDEFAILLPGSSKQGAEALSLRIREAIEGVQLDLGSLRVSVGVAAAEHGCVAAAAIMTQADEALYRDKASRKRKQRQHAA